MNDIGMRAARSCPGRSRLRVVGVSAGHGRSGVARSRPGPSWKPGGRRGPGFAKGHRDRVVISDRGRSGSARRCCRRAARRRPRLGPGPDPAMARSTRPPATRARSFAEATKDVPPGPWLYDATDTQALALAVPPDGHVFVGTGPSGQVVDLTDPKHPASRPDPKVQYIWDLAADPRATSSRPPARPASSGSARATASGRCSSTASIPSALRGGRAGRRGLRRQRRRGADLPGRREGKVSVLYDAPQTEIRTLLAGTRRMHSTPARPPRPAGRRVEPGSIALLDAATFRSGRAEYRSRFPVDRWRRGRAADPDGRRSRLDVGRRPPDAPRPPAAGSAAPAPSRPATTPSTGSTPTASPARSSGSRR